MPTEEQPKLEKRLLKSIIKCEMKEGSVFIQRRSILCPSSGAEDILWMSHLPVCDPIYEFKYLKLSEEGKLSGTIANCNHLSIHPYIHPFSIPACLALRMVGVLEPIPDILGQS